MCPLHVPGLTPMKSELIELLTAKSFQYAEEPVFRLVSGRTSRFYVNCKPVTLHPRGLVLIGNLVFDAVKTADATAVGGLTFGADPIAVATALISEQRHKPVKAFSVRKQKKDHGIVKWIEGDIQPQERVAVIDDVVTTGSSTIKAIERIREEGLLVDHAIVLVDRQEGGVAALQRYVSHVVVIVTRDELLDCWQRRKAT